MKKLVLLLTVILLALCLTACGERSANNFDYTVNSDGKTCTITGFDSDLPELLEIFEDWGWIDGNSYYNANLTIPTKLNGYTVTEIGRYAFYGCYSLKSVVIPDSVTSIGYSAFENCSSLTSVVIPDSVTSIGDRAFCNCSSLTSVVIPDSITNIGSYTFYGCSSLTSVVIPDSVTSIGSYAFYGCNSLTSIVIPDSVTNIGSGALAYCGSLINISVSAENQNYTDIDGNIYSKDELTLVQYATGKTDISFIIPNSVTSIGNHAFAGCHSFKSINIPDSVTSIGRYAFENCSSLTSVVIPDSVTSFGYSAFSGCSSLTSVVIGDSITSISDYAFQYCSSLTSVVIPDSVTSIGSSAFSGCSSLTSVVIPDSVTSIGSSAFSGCSSLNEVYISDITAWCGIKFSSCDSNPMYYWADLYLNGELVTEIELPDTISSIKYSAFSGCSSLTSVVIPDSVTSIGDRAFCNCSSLTSVVIPDSVTNIGYSAFENCSSIAEVYITDINAWCNIVFTNNAYSNPLCYGADLYINGEIVKEIELSNSVSSINDFAFWHCNSLISIIIPDSVTNIGYSSFNGCSSLTSVVIPDSVTSIGDYAFCNCSSLTSIVIPDSVTSIGNGAFGYCSSLTSIVIPDGVTSIGNGAFWECISLTSVVIPDGVTSIGDYAFWECNNLCILYNNSNLNLIIGDESYGGIAKYAEVIVNKDGMFSIDDEYKYILTDDGFLFRYKQGEYTLIAYDGRESKVTLPKKINGSTYSLEEIKAFEIILPEWVTSIEANSFSSILRSITIPASVTSIDAEAFKNCTRLKNIEVSEENTVYKSVDGNLYAKDGKTLIKYAVGKTDEQFIIPNEMVEISIDTPEDLKYIESVVIHNGVTNIADSAFSGCNHLEYVYFTGTQEEWKKVVIGTNNDYLIDAIIVYEYVAEE